jgi:hypothetical protein
VSLHKTEGGDGLVVQGDDFNPQGTLTGGSRRQDQSILAKVKELQEIEAHLHKLQVCSTSVSLMLLTFIFSRAVATWLVHVSLWQSTEHSAGIHSRFAVAT